MRTERTAASTRHLRFKAKPQQRNRTAYLIFFAFNRIVSSSTKIPLPLYGSGTLHFLIFAAKLLTTSFSDPSNSILVGCGVLAFTPCGMPSSMGCE